MVVNNIYMRKTFIQCKTITISLLLVAAAIVAFLVMTGTVQAITLSASSSVETQAAMKSSYAVGEEVPFKLIRGTDLGTSTLAVHLSASNGGLFSGGNLSGSCSGIFEEPSTPTIAADTTNKAFCYKATAAGMETISIILGGEEEFLSYEINIVAGTCTDGVLNQDETAIDEGGVCTVVVFPEVCPVGTTGMFPVCIPVIVAPVDVCPNLEGVQSIIPEGYERLEDSKACTEIPPTAISADFDNRGGTRIGSRHNPNGQVLGASTMQCGMLLDTYMKMGQDNDQNDVMQLQWFLIGQGYTLSATGVFDAATDAAVRAFQEANLADVLTPWVTAGILKVSNPTGWVYQLTRWKINNIVCPGSEAAPVLLP